MLGTRRLRAAESFAGPDHTAQCVAGRLASERYAIGKSEYYGYDAVANLLWRTDGDRQSTYYVFDPLARQVRIDFPEGYSAYFTYDAAGRLSRLENRKSDATVISRFEFARDPNGRGIGKRGQEPFSPPHCARPESMARAPHQSRPSLQCRKRSLSPFPVARVSHHRGDTPLRDSSLALRMTGAGREDGSCWYYFDYNALGGIVNPSQEHSGLQMPNPRGRE